jgi:16S rRNA A1518/A1519 N6-dimethyltransferase RsmA/KsgA/DIM1 with predicted DNA glycosylase/AP lyase activity
MQSAGSSAKLQRLDELLGALSLGAFLSNFMDLLRHRAKLLEAVEVDPTLAATLQRRFAGANVNVRCGNATNMPYDDGLFSAVVSFTMLHHIPSPELQDQFVAKHIVCSNREAFSLAWTACRLS